MISTVNLQYAYPKSDVYVYQCLLKRLIKLCHSIQALIQYPHKTLRLFPLSYKFCNNWLH